MFAFTKSDTQIAIFEPGNAGHPLGSKVSNLSPCANGAFPLPGADVAGL
jgi:hypothetical protein